MNIANSGKGRSLAAISGLIDAKARSARMAPIVDNAATKTAILAVCKASWSSAPKALCATSEPNEGALT